MRFFLVPAFLITLVGMASAVTLQSLDKLDLLSRARLDLALRPGNFGALAWIASPLIGNLLLTFFWRDRHPFAGFMLAVILAALTAWGNLVDWLIWRDNGKPGEPIRFLVAGYTAWAGWGLVLVFWITGLILHRGKPVMPPPKPAGATIPS